MAMATTPAANGTTHNAGPLLEGKEPVADSASCTPAGLQAALDSYGWVLHLGPLSLGRHGVDVRPQLKLGGRVGNVVAEVGVGDVRDGLRFETGVKAFAEAEGSGHSLEELHANVRRRLGESAASMGSAIGAVTNSTKVDEVLEAAGRILSSSAKGLGSRTDEIAKALGVDVADLERTLAGETASAAAPAGNGEAPGSGDAEGPPMTLRVRASTGLGASCQMSLGWCDTSGYHMVGLGMEAVALVATGANLFAGRHRSGVGAKVVLGISNFTLEYAFPRARTPERAPNGGPAAERQSPAGPAGKDAAGAGAAEGGTERSDAAAERQSPRAPAGADAAGAAGAGAAEGSTERVEGPRSRQA